MLALPAQLVHVVEQAVGKYIHLLDDHAIRVQPAVIAGLGEDLHPLRDELQAVFLHNDLSHGEVLASGHRIQDRLGHSVADGRVQGLPFPVGELVDLFSQLTEGGELAPHQLWYNVFLNLGYIPIGEEEGIPPTCARILNRGAIAIGHLTVFQD